jgi:hypothetical protein
MSLNTRFKKNLSVADRQFVRQIKALNYGIKTVKENDQQGREEIARRIARRLRIPNVAISPAMTPDAVGTLYSQTFQPFAPSDLIRKQLKPDNYKAMFVGHGSGYGPSWQTTAQINQQNVVINPYDLAKQLAKPGERCLMMVCDDKTFALPVSFKTGKTVVVGSNVYSADPKSIRQAKLTRFAKAAYLVAGTMSFIVRGKISQIFK